MYRWLPALLLACGCSSDSKPLDPFEPDASTGNGSQSTSETSDTDTDTSAAPTREDTETSGTSSGTDDSSSANTDLDAGPDADADTQACEPLGQGDCSGFDCNDYSSMSYEAALDDLQLRCAPYQAAYAGEGCGYRILKYAFGAGDTFMAFYDSSSRQIVGWKYVTDMDGVGACAGEVPEACFEYGFSAPPNGQALCLDAGAPAPDAEVPDPEVPDAEVPDANVPDPEVPDAATVDASDAAQ